MNDQVYDVVNEGVAVETKETNNDLEGGVEHNLRGFTVRL
jgi:hypothetical protein